MMIVVTPKGRVGERTTLCIHIKCLHTKNGNFGGGRGGGRGEVGEKGRGLECLGRRGGRASFLPMSALLNKSVAMRAILGTVCPSLTSLEQGV